MAIGYWDGKFVEKSSITISVSDYGFARGISVFEFLRVYDGSPFRLDDHLARLEHGAEVMGIKMPLSRAEVAAAVHQIIVQNNYPHSSIKFYLTAGECASQPAGFASATGFTPHLMIMEEPIKTTADGMPYEADYYNRGKKLKIVPFEREFPTVKSINYQTGYVASLQAGAAWDDVLYSHRDGYITEVTRANFFCVIDGILCTPDTGMLFGVTRKVLLELLAKYQIPYAVRKITPSELSRATEAFTTGSIAEMLPTSQIDDHKLPTTTDGPVFSKLRKLFSDCIKAECGSLKQVG